MSALLARPGFTATRYQGDTVRFNAQTRVLELQGKPAAVQRDQTLLVGQAIAYNDSTQIVVARPDSAKRDSVILRDPTQGDVVVRGAITYYLAERRGTISEFQTAITSGETWYVQGERGALVTDSLIEGKRYVFARDGSITSCNEVVPHYHFQSREIKMVTRSLLVVRPAVLYIADVPVLWLPFVFQDLRTGRRSGILTPQFGVAELVRNSPAYKRSIQNLGYYFNLGNYADASAWLDFRSGARGDAFDPGSLKLNAETRYRVIDRFLQGRLSTSYTAQRDGTRNAAVSLSHEQAFNQQRRLSASINWVQNTTVQRQNQLNPAAVLGTIASQVNLQDRFGPASLSLGGTRKQYPGRDQVDHDFPNLNLTTRTIQIGENVDWTPTLSLTQLAELPHRSGDAVRVRLRPQRGGRARQHRHQPVAPQHAAAPRVRRSRSSTSTGRTRSASTRRSRTSRRHAWSSGTRATRRRRSGASSTRRTSRASTGTRPSASRASCRDRGTCRRRSASRTSMPPRVSSCAASAPAAGGSPSGSAPRSARAPRRRSTPSRRDSGAVERFRHSINPVFSYSYSPKADVSDEYLSAIGRSRQGYLGSLVQNRVSLQFSTNLEAKLRGRSPTAPESGTPARPDSSAARPDSLARDSATVPVRTDAGRLGGRRGAEGPAAVDELHAARVRLRARRLARRELHQPARLHDGVVRHQRAVGSRAGARLPHDLLALPRQPAERHRASSARSAPTPVRQLLARPELGDLRRARAPVRAAHPARRRRRAWARRRRTDRATRRGATRSSHARRSRSRSRAAAPATPPTTCRTPRAGRRA